MIGGYWSDDPDPPDENAGLPRCQQCNAVLLNGSAEAWMEKGDVGGWENLELICSECAASKKKTHTPLLCECLCCTCREHAVAVTGGNLSCSKCLQPKHPRGVI